MGRFYYLFFITFTFLNLNISTFTYAQETSSSQNTINRGGDTYAEAEPLGTLRGANFDVSDALNAQDNVDFFSVELATYASLKVELNNFDEGIKWKITVYDLFQQKIKEQIYSEKLSVLITKPLTPAQYIIKIELVEPKKELITYSLSINRAPIKDTGFANANAEHFDDISNILEIDSYDLIYLRSGYVGKGDFADVYPIEMVTNEGAIKLTVTDLAAPLMLRILSEDQKILAEKQFTKDGENSIIAPIKHFSRGFIQISAVQNSPGTTYKFNAKSVPAAPNAFAPTQASSGVLDKSEHDYKGIIGGNSLEWHFKIPVNQYSNTHLILSGLSANVDMQIRDDNDRTISNDHIRSGNENEIFKEDLEPGLYSIRLTLKEKQKSTPFTFRFSTEKPKIAQAAKILTISEARKNATILDLTESFAVNEYEVAGVKYFKFMSKDYPANYIFELSNFSARSNLNLYLEDRTGQTIAKSENPGSEPEPIQSSLKTTEVHFLRVEALGLDPISSFRLTYLYKRGLTSIKPHAGKLISTHGDWEVRQQEDGGYCVAITEAESYIPASGNWTEGKIPDFSILYRKGKSEITIGLLNKGDKKSDYVNVTILSGGKWKRIKEMKFDRKRLEPLNSENYISTNALRSFTRGTKLNIETSLDGIVYEITYSLLGYTAANRAANKYCGAKAGWTVRR